MSSKPVPDTSNAANRRDFLKLAALGAPATAASVIVAPAAQAAQPSGDGYRETAHVRAYLASARF